MRRLSFALVLLAVGGGAFLLGRTTSSPAADTDQRETTRQVTAAPSPSPPVTKGAPQKHRSILRYFAAVDEEALPKQGILGGTMIAGTIAFPKGFDRASGERFYAVGSDGHLLETWIYEMKNHGGWKHVATHDGYAPVDFQNHLDAYNVYLWRPAFYIPAEED